MKKIKKSMKNYNNIAKILAGFAMIFSTIAANSQCFYIFHNPAAPEELKKLKKF